jgi:magnesium-transporting ATPase (P-type)
MEFKKMSAGKFAYGSDISHCEDALYNDVTNFNFIDDSFCDHLQSEHHPNNKNIKDMLFHLAICHTIVVDMKENKQFYNASSPDELALVNAAKYFKYVFKGRDEENYIEMSVNNENIRV